MIKTINTYEIKQIFGATANCTCFDSIVTPYPKNKKELFESTISYFSRLAEQTFQTKEISLAQSNIMWNGTCTKRQNCIEKCCDDTGALSWNFGAQLANCNY